MAAITCPSCKGARGKMVWVKENVRWVKKWFDCSTCGGIGTVGG